MRRNRSANDSIAEETVQINTCEESEVVVIRAEISLKLCELYKCN